MILLWYFMLCLGLEEVEEVIQRLQYSHISLEKAPMSLNTHCYFSLLSWNALCICFQYIKK